MVRECYVKLVKIVEEQSGVQLHPGEDPGDAVMEDVAAAVAGMAIEKGYVGEPSRLDCSVCMTFY